MGDPAAYSVTLSLGADVRIARWRPLGFIYLGVAVAVFLAFFAVLFTGRYPQGLRDFVVGGFRFGTRLTAYAYLLVDDYPPLTTA